MQGQITQLFVFIVSAGCLFVTRHKMMQPNVCFLIRCWGYEYCVAETSMELTIVNDLTKNLSEKKNNNKIFRLCKFLKNITWCHGLHMRRAVKSSLLKQRATSEANVGM